MDAKKRTRDIGKMLEYFGVNASAVMIEIYLSGTQNLSDDALESAIGKAISNLDRRPMISDLLRIASGTTKESLEAEVGQIVEQLKEIFRGPGGGRYSSHILPPRSMWVIQYLGGLQYFSNMSDEQFAWARKADIPKALAICPPHPDIDHVPGLMELSPEKTRYRLVNHVKGLQKLIA